MNAATLLRLIGAGDRDGPKRLLLDAPRVGVHLFASDEPGAA